MNKEYIKVDNKIVIRNEEGISKVIPYSKNVDEILILENQISLLSRYLEIDSQKLVQKTEERESRLKSYKKITPFINIAAVAASFVCSIIFTVGNNSLSSETFHTFQKFFITTTTASLLTANAITLLDLIYRPSQNELTGYQEMINYEQKALEDKQQKLESIKNKYHLNKPDKKEQSPIQIDDEKELKIIKQMRDLSYSYGKNTIAFLEIPIDDLKTDMLHYGFLPETISLFIPFIEKKQQENKNDSYQLTIQENNSQIKM